MRKYVFQKADDFQRRVEDLHVKIATTSLIRFSTWKKFEDVHKLFFFDKTLPLHEVRLVCCFYFSYHRFRFILFKISESDNYPQMSMH